MSPELQKLLEAFYEKLSCPPEEKPQRVANFERLMQDALALRPDVSRDEFLNALNERLREFMRVRRKPPTMPPRA